MTEQNNMSYDEDNIVQERIRAKYIKQGQHITFRGANARVNSTRVLSNGKMDIYLEVTNPWGKRILWPVYTWEEEFVRCTIRRISLYEFLTSKPGK
jgi:hypothetical protein